MSFEVLKQLFREMLGIEADAFVVLTNHRTGKVRVIPGRNIVTDEGDKWYAQSACGESPTYTFANLYLATAGPATPAKDDDYSDYTVHAGSEKTTMRRLPPLPTTWAL